MNNTNTTTPNFDNLLLQSLMSRLQLRHQPPPPSTTTTDNQHPLLSQSFEDFLLEAATSANFSSDEDYNNNDDDDDEDDFDFKTNLSKEESKLEKELIKVILTGKTDSLKPNTGQAVSIGEHHVCVGFHEESGSEYRVWEWHGHIMLFDEENGYTPEYIYGNYFERLVAARKEKKVEKEEEAAEEEKGECLGGLKELIDGAEAVDRRVLHQSRNAGSPRCLKDTNGN